MSLDSKTLKENYYKSLVSCLEQLVKVYRHLLEVVRQEKEILIASELDELAENNKGKEATLIKLKSLETQRIKHAKDLAGVCGVDIEQPRLLEIAAHFSGAQANKLHNLHSVLDLLVRRVNDLNKENEQLVQSALRSISGAMDSIKDEYQDKNTYGDKGGMKASKNIGASILSKDV